MRQSTTTVRRRRVGSEMLAILDGLSQSVASAPADTQLRRIYADALEDAGDAKRAACQRRIAAACLPPYRVRLSPRAATAVRQAAGEGRCPVEVVAGDSPPVATGERGYSEFKGGGICHHPGAAMRAGYRVRYVASTRTVRVGVIWLIANGYLK